MILPPCLTRGASAEARPPGHRTIARASVSAAQEAPVVSRPMLASGLSERVPQLDSAVGLRRVGPTALQKQAGLLASDGRIASLPRWTTRFHLDSSPHSAIP